nr:molybdenum cofactor guanylyltransferase [Cohnella algarum]
MAGGRGRRMGGRNKALLAFDGEPFIRKQCRAAIEWAEELVIVAPASPELAGAVDGLARLGREIRFVPDDFAGEGPLAGLHAGLKAAARPHVWALACDQPQPSVAAARLLLERLTEEACAAAVPLIGGRAQPLHALYRAELASACAELLSRGERRLGALLDAIAWTGVAEEEFKRAGASAAFAFDVDTPDDYGRLLRGEAGSTEA